MEVALCDDDPKMFEQILKIMKDVMNQNGVSFTLDFYSSGEELICSGRKVLNYSLIFLDVMMDGMNGIKTAAQLRKSGSTAYIVFISGVIEAAPDGYAVNAYRYILKNMFLEDNLKSCIQTLLDKNMGMYTYFKNKKYNEEFSIEITKILYFESQLRKIILHYNTGHISAVYEFYGKLQDIETKYKNHGFARVHKGYLINLDHAKELKKNEIILSDGTRIPISAKKFTEVKRLFLLWKAGYKYDY